MILTDLPDIMSDLILYSPPSVAAGHLVLVPGRAIAEGIGGAPPNSGDYGDYSGDYNGDYSVADYGEYDGGDYADYNGNFTGDYNDYTGDYGDYNGDYTSDYGDYTGDYGDNSVDYSGDYTGDY